MSQKASEETSTEETSTSSLSWPLSGGCLTQTCYGPLARPSHFNGSQHEGAISDKTNAVMEKSGADAILRFHLSFRTKSPSSGVQLRGGGRQRHAGKFGWLKTARTVEKTPDSKSEHSPFRVIYKGREIGSPQPAPALNVLPPASRFTREPASRAAATTARSPLDNSGNVHTDISPTPLGRDDRSAAHLQTPSLHPPSALLATPSQPATSNPFAGVYGNPYTIRTGPAFHPIDYELAGSLVDRPSALNGSQTDYGLGPNPPRENPLRLFGEVPISGNSPCGVGANLRMQQVRTDRKWDPLPPLPPGEGASEAALEVKDGEESRDADDEYFDTEKVLGSLRPERLSLYHIGTPGRSVNSSANAENNSVAITDWPAQTVAVSTRKQANDNILEASDHYSVRTRDWDLQSCNTDDLGIDNRLQWEEQLAKCSPQHLLPQEQQRQARNNNNNEALDGLPEKDAPTPEIFFYADMIEIVNFYHEQLQRVVQRAYEAGEISEEHWLREKWRHRAAMDRKLRIAEDMSGYKILTNETDIKEAIQQSTGYAIYRSLLKVRDPETWQRIFEPTLTHSQLGVITSTSQQRATIPVNPFMFLLRKIGRGLRFMLAVPDNADLKTYSSRHPPAPAPNTMTYQSNVGVLGPNITSQPLNTSKSTTPSPASAPTIQSSLSRNFAPHDQPRPSTQTERAAKLSSDTTRVNNNTTFTGLTLTSPPNSRIVKAPRSRGYEEGAFVTIIAPRVVSNDSEKTLAEYGAGKPGKRQRVRDDGTEITAWPGADC